MNIQSARYLDAEHTTVQVNDNLCVPVEPLNRDWRKVAAWVASGGVIAEFVPPPPVPPQGLRDAAIEALLIHTAGLQTYPQAIKDYANHPARPGRGQGG